MKAYAQLLRLLIAAGLIYLAVYGGMLYEREGSADLALEVAEKNRIKTEKSQAAFNHLAKTYYESENRNYETKRDLQGQLGAIHNKKPVQTSSCSNPDVPIDTTTADVVRVLQEADDRSGLPKSSDRPYFIGDGNDIQSYCLSLKIDRNRLATKVNTLSAAYIILENKKSPVDDTEAFSEFDD